MLFLICFGSLPPPFLLENLGYPRVEVITIHGGKQGTTGQPQAEDGSNRPEILAY